MKFLAFMLSIYIFALNLVPCEGTQAYDHEIKSEISQDLDDPTSGCRFMFAFL